MARVRYDVVPNGSWWSVKSSGVSYGDFMTQKEATRSAVDRAHDLGKDGHDAQVYVHGTDGRFRLEWTYGNDPYPPRG